MTLHFPKPKRIWSTGKEPSAAETQELEDIRKECFDDFGAFIRRFFPGHFWGEFSAMHRDVIDLERNPLRRGVLEATAAPRGNAKTVFRVLAKVIHSIVYGYQPFTVIIGYSAQEAEGKVKDIRDELLHNEEIKRVYGQMLKKNAGTTGFIAKNGCMVLARGRGGQVRGLRHGKYRPTHIICDDVEELEACQSPLQRDKTKQWFTKDVMPAIQSGNDEAIVDAMLEMELDDEENIVIPPPPQGTPDEFKGDITFVGTVLHDDSLLANLLKDPSWERHKYKAVIQWATQSELWEQWRELYCNLDDPKAKITARKFFLKNREAMLEGTQVLWPEGESYYKLMVDKIKLGDAAFSSEKQNEPFDPDMQILDPSICPRFKVYTPQDPEWLEELGETGFAIVRRDGKAILSKDLTIIAFLDPALGKDKKKGGGNKKDYAALVVCAQDPNGYIYLLDVWMQKQPPSKQIDAAYMLHQKWGFETLYLETVGFQELMKPLFKEQAKNWEYELRVIGVGQYHNKQARITTLQPYFVNKWLLMAENLNAEFLNQIKLFPTADHDDGPDALQGAVAKLRKPIGGIRTLSNPQGVI
jgi:predicted phage terminase large subunit-like protein